MKFRGLVVAALAAGLFGVFAIDASAFNKEPKYTLKEIMKAQKDGFFKKAAAKMHPLKTKKSLLHMPKLFAKPLAPRATRKNGKPR